MRIIVDESAKQKSKKGKVKKDVVESDVFFSSKRIRLKDYGAAVAVLGAVLRVTETYLKVSLPGGFTASVHRTDFHDSILVIYFPYDNLV